MCRNTGGQLGQKPNGIYYSNALRAAWPSWPKMGEDGEACCATELMCSGPAAPSLGDSHIDKPMNQRDSESWQTPAPTLGCEAPCSESNEQTLPSVRPLRVIKATRMLHATGAAKAQWNMGEDREACCATELMCCGPAAPSLSDSHIDKPKNFNQRDSTLARE